MRRIVVMIAFSILGCTALKPGTDVRTHDSGQMNPDSGTRDGGTSDGGTRDGGMASPDSGPRDGGSDAGIDAGPPIGVRQLALGSGHTCLLDLAGRVICWGANDEGQLGRPVSGPADPAVVAGAPDVDEICAGGDFTCARVGPDVLCWGGNTSGELGIGSTERRTAPAAVALPAGVVASRIACGFDIACAVSDTGALYCWGDNATNQILLSTTLDQLTPTRVSVRGAVVGSLSVGANHTCAGLDGSAAGVYCWGDNSFGQIVTPASSAPIGATRIGGADLRLVTAGARHTCSHTGTTLTCRGERPQSSPVPSFAAPIDIDSGEDFSCALAEDRLVCWGVDRALQLGGTGSSPNEIEEVSVPAVLLGLGRQHGCVIDGSGLLCWGQNGMSQIERGLPNTVPPTRIDLDRLLRL